MVYNQALVRYALEGLLLRLSLSRHADRFILKGDMLYVLWKPEKGITEASLSSSAFLGASVAPILQVPSNRRALMNQAACYEGC